MILATVTETLKGLATVSGALAAILAFIVVIARWKPVKWIGRTTWRAFVGDPVEAWATELISNVQRPAHEALEAKVQVAWKALDLKIDGIKADVNPNGGFSSYDGLKESIRAVGIETSRSFGAIDQQISDLHTEVKGVKSDVEVVRTDVESAKAAAAEAAAKAAEAAAKVAAVTVTVQPS